MSYWSYNDHISVENIQWIDDDYIGAVFKAEDEIPENTSDSAENAYVFVVFNRKTAPSGEEYWDENGEGYYPSNLM